MANKLFKVGLIWIVVIFAYIIMAASMDATNEIISDASASLATSANMSNFPGTQEAVDSAPMWLWVIPGAVGMVVTGIMLVKKD